MTTTEQIQATYNHVEEFIGDCMSAYIDEGMDMESEEYMEEYKENVWVLAIDFVNTKRWDSVIAEIVKEKF
jgi:DNA-binding ferritin-like protein (Dps family)